MRTPSSFILFIPSIRYPNLLSSVKLLPNFLILKLDGVQSALPNFLINTHQVSAYINIIIFQSLISWYLPNIADQEQEGC